MNINSIEQLTSKEILSMTINKKVPKLYRATSKRWIALALAALLMVGNNYAFDNPSALQQGMMTELNISLSEYNLMYTVFAFPNIFLTVIGGVFIDKIGVRKGVVIFSTLIAISQFVVALGGSIKSYYLILVGRALFGINSENLIVAQAAIMGQWFKGKELSLAMGIIMTVPELGSAMNSFLSPFFYEMNKSLVFPLFFSAGLCVLSVIAAIGLALIDRIADKQDKNNRSLDQEDEPQGESVSFKDIKELSATFWILIMICTLTLAMYIPFLDDVNQFYIDRFGFTTVEAGRLITIPYLTSIIASPFLGTLVDKIGKRRIFIIITICTFILSHFLFGLLPQGDSTSPDWFSVIPLVFIGTGYSLYSCAIISCIQLVAEERIMGTAFGLMAMCESVALASFPLISAIIADNETDRSQGFTNVAFFYAGIGMFALLLAFSLYFFDKKGSKILDMKAVDDLIDEDDKSDSEDESDIDETSKTNKETKRNPKDIDNHHNNVINVTMNETGIIEHEQDIIHDNDLIENSKDQEITK